MLERIPGRALECFRFHRSSMPYTEGSDAER